MAAAAPLRVAVWNADLSRDGPGLLLQELRRGAEPLTERIVTEIARLQPDVLLLSRVDIDYQNLAVSALQAALAKHGADYPHALAPPQNRGLASDFDLSGDGRAGGPGDVQGWGRYSGDGAMVLLSRWPLHMVQDHTALLWRDLPGGGPAGRPPVQRLASSGYWIVGLELPGGQGGHLLVWAAGAERFEGVERTAAETGFWRHWLDGAFGTVPPGGLILMGHPNRPGRSGFPGHPRLNGQGVDTPGGALILTSAPWQITGRGMGAPDQPGGRFPQQMHYVDLRLSDP